MKNQKKKCKEIIYRGKRASDSTEDVWLCSDCGRKVVLAVYCSDMTNTELVAVIHSEDVLEVLKS